MSHTLMVGFLVLAMPALASAAESPAASKADNTDPRVAASRAIVTDFGAQLRAALEKALAEKGPAAAIGVCKDEAPAIAAALSTRHGAAVARTGLRVRNPANSPQPWQSTALKHFEAQLAQGKRAEELESFEVRPDGGARYLKAIGVQPLCLTCHGQSIAPEVREAIAKYYPADQATGFKLGDLRGAFSVEWPRSTPQAESTGAR